MKRIVSAASDCRPVVMILRTLARVVLCTALLVVTIVPAHGLWMPWATEADRIQKTLNDFRHALAMGDKEGAQELLTGSAPELYVEQKLDELQRLGIRKQECNLVKVTIDPSTGTWAFADVEYVSELPSGQVIRARVMNGLRKIDGVWKLNTDFASRNKKEKKNTADPSVSDPLAGVKKKLKGN